MEKAGISLWRQVSESLAEDIEKGVLKPNERLPTAETLAARFAVNRHTVLKAVQHLQTEGLVRTERGRGSYAIVNPIELRLGARSWFEQNLRESNRTPTRTIVSINEIPASPEVATALKIEKAAPVLHVIMLGEADGFPVNYTYNYFPLRRIPGLARAFEAIGNKPAQRFSFSELLKSVGIQDPRRKTIRIRSRPPTREEAHWLKMPAAGHVLLTDVVQVDAKNRPVVYAETCYSAGRVSLVVDLDPK